MGKKRPAPFAHVLGTLKGGIEKIPGTVESLDTSSGEANVYDSKSRGNVTISFKTDAATAELRRFLLHTMRSCRELYSTFRHLGLPETSVQTKMPYYRCCTSFRIRPCSRLQDASWDRLSRLHACSSFLKIRWEPFVHAWQAAPDMLL